MRTKRYYAATDRCLKTFYVCVYVCVSPPTLGKLGVGNAFLFPLILLC